MRPVEIRIGDRTAVVTIDGDSARFDDQSFTVIAVGRGVYRVSDGSRQWTVAVAGPAEDRWLFVDGRVARVGIGLPSPIQQKGASRRDHHFADDLVSPMPATVLRVLVEPGATVARGATLIVLEAMKMELPIRAPRDGVVRTVHCQEGELVPPGVRLLELE